MSLVHVFLLMLDPSRLLLMQGLRPDPWQRELLLSREQFVLLNCSRQSGKSTTVAALALHRLLTTPGSLVLLVAPSERQSHELFRKLLAGYQASGRLVPAVKHNQSELELANGARVVALPGREETIRSFSGVDLLVIDEAARVPDDLYRSVRPMLAVSRGRLLGLSTPFGQRGWFYEEWTGQGPWKRIHIPWTECPRIDSTFIAEETRALGKAWVDQEYAALFTSMEGLVYPDFGLALADVEDFGFLIGDFGLQEPSTPAGEAIKNPQSKIQNLMGGIDFGWRNPFAAVWGVVDDDDVLWILGERYLRETPISEHAKALPAKCTWYADPANRTEIEELRRHGHLVKKADNSLRRGIALVTERVRTGKLKVVKSACPNLLQEAKLYRYPTENERKLVGENPIDADNHALAALRYLVAMLDRGRRRRFDSVGDGEPAGLPSR